MDNRKPIRVYLDQNVLGRIFGLIPNSPQQNFKIIPVYSFPHLEEIANGEDEAFRNRVCAWLSDNGAELLQLVKTGDDPNSTFNKFFEFMKPHLTTGQVKTKGSDVASFVRVDPIQSVQSIVLQRANKGPMNMLQVIGLKLAGGFQDQTIEELVSPYIEEIKKTNEDSRRKLEEYSAIDPQEAERVQAFLRDISVPDAEADRVKETLVTTFEDAIQKLKMTSGMQDYRQALGLDPKILNNLEPPNVFRKIYDLACCHSEIIEHFFHVWSCQILSIIFDRWKEIRRAVTLRPENKLVSWSMLRCHVMLF